jgi:hypothetical protein
MHTLLNLHYTFIDTHDKFQTYDLWEHKPVVRIKVKWWADVDLQWATSEPYDWPAFDFSWVTWPTPLHTTDFTFQQAAMERTFCPHHNTLGLLSSFSLLLASAGYSFLPYSKRLSLSSENKSFIMYSITWLKLLV